VKSLMALVSSRMLFEAPRPPRCSGQSSGDEKHVAVNAAPSAARVNLMPSSFGRALGGTPGKTRCPAATKCVLARILTSHARRHYGASHMARINRQVPLPNLSRLKGYVNVVRP
jgi:hypothetical protein